MKIELPLRIRMGHNAATALGVHDSTDDFWQRIWDDVPRRASAAYFTLSATIGEAREMLSVAEASDAYRGVNTNPLLVSAARRFVRNARVAITVRERHSNDHAT